MCSEYATAHKTTSVSPSTHVAPTPTHDRQPGQRDRAAEQRRRLGRLRSQTACSSGVMTT